MRWPRVGDDSQITGLNCDQLRRPLEAVRRRAATGAGQSRRDLTLVTLLAHNGLRIGKAAAADVADLATERGHRMLRVTRKGGRPASVPLAPVTAPTRSTRLRRTWNSDKPTGIDTRSYRFCC